VKLNTSQKVWAVLEIEEDSMFKLTMGSDTLLGFFFPVHFCFYGSEDQTQSILHSRQSLCHAGL
jgi:hypothetical protein